MRISEKRAKALLGEAWAQFLKELFLYELDRSYELRQQKQFYPMAYDYGCDYYDHLLELKTDRTENGRMVKLTHDADVSYQEYAEPFYVWEIKEANTAKREGRKPRGQPRERKPNWKELYASVRDIHLLHQPHQQVIYFQI